MTTKLNQRVFLKASKPSGIHEWVNYFFEQFLFFRWMLFKNHPRSNLLLIRSALIMGIFSSLYYLLFSSFNFILMGIDIDPIIAVSIAIIIGYWNMAHSFQAKTNYLSNMYNEMIKEWGLGHHYSAKMISINLSIQTLTLDLWGHRIYGPLFVKTLDEAIDYAYSTANQDKGLAMSIAPSHEACVEKVNSQKLRVSEARHLLWLFQTSVVNQTSTELQHSYQI